VRPPQRSYPLGLVLEACPDIADYARNGISSWRDLVATAATVRSIIGSSPSAWEDANTVLGLEDPAVLVAAIVQSGTAIQSAGGARGYDGNRIVLTGASLGTGVATATHEAAALVLESPYLSALDVASARYAIFPVSWFMLDKFRSDLAIRDVHVPVLMVRPSTFEGVVRFS